MTEEQQKEYIINSLCVLIAKFIKNDAKTEITFVNIAYDLAERALEDLHYSYNHDLDTNGWQVDYWASFTNSDRETLLVSGSMYHGNLEISKGND